MEKIFLKPIPREILIKGSQKEGHLDIFSYDYESDEDKRKLGSLYIIGNIQQDPSTTNISSPGKEARTSETDVAYITNLVASLAKREYYSNTDLSPKESFASTLKKVNDVVNEFFLNKDVKINIGIFALAGENINISKIGKFKILLARDGKNIDILNNIDLFTKEKIEEKEFSHIVSGKTAPRDKILAFYPGRFITAREKTLKENFLRLNTEQFVEKIDAIKEEGNDFACAALYINLNRVKEPAVAPKKNKKSTLPPVIAPETGEELIQENAPIILASEPKKTHLFQSARQQYTVSEAELPRIIRSEFALGKKENPVVVALGKIKMFLPKRQNKIVFFVSLGALVIFSAWAVKSFLIISPSQRQTATAINQARDNIKLSKTKISQNDFLGARKILLDSITNINTVTSSNKIENAKSEILKLLDGLDQAVESSPILTEILPKSVSDKASLLAVEKEKTGAIGLDIYEDNLYFIIADGISKITDVSSKSKNTATAWLKSGALPPDPLLMAVDGKVYILNKSGLLTTYYKGAKQGEINTLILPDDSSVFTTTKNSQYLYLINKNMGRIYLISKANGTLSKTLKVSSQEAFTAAYLDQDEAVYLVSKDNKIWKVQ